MYARLPTDGGYLRPLAAEAHDLLRAPRFRHGDRPARWTRARSADSSSRAARHHQPTRPPIAQQTRPSARSERPKKSASRDLHARSSGARYAREKSNARAFSPGDRKKFFTQLPPRCDGGASRISEWGTRPRGLQLRGAEKSRRMRCDGAVNLAVSPPGLWFGPSSSRYSPVARSCGIAISR